MAGRAFAFSVQPDGSGVDAALARAALEDYVGRVVRLIDSIERPDAPAVGVWNTANVATHLSHAWQVLSALAQRQTASPINDVRELGALTRSRVAADTAADMHEVAARIDAAASTFFAHFDSHAPQDTAPWLVKGVEASLVTIACHLLNETVVHGFDMARAQSVPWRVDPAAAAMTVFGFLMPQLTQLDARAMVVENAAAGLRATFEIRIRRFGRFVLAFDDGSVRVDPSPEPRIDYRLSAESTTFFLLLWTGHSCAAASSAGGGGPCSVSGSARCCATPDTNRCNPSHQCRRRFR